MKKITIDNRELLYKIKEHECDEYGAFVCYETIFYDPIPKIKKYKKYILFGPYIEKKYYEKLFTIDINLESNRYTKKDIKKYINRELELLNRDNEIKNGNII